MRDGVAPYQVEERLLAGETRWVAIRARGAKWSYLTPAEAADIGKQWVKRFGAAAVDRERGVGASATPTVRTEERIMNTHSPRKIANLRQAIKSEVYHKCSGALLFLAIAIISEPVCARVIANSKPPTRIANIYGGLNHQPTRGEIENRERAAGIEPRSTNDDAVRQLYELLMTKAHTG